MTNARHHLPSGEPGAAPARSRRLVPLPMLAMLPLLLALACAAPQGTVVAPAPATRDVATHVGPGAAAQAITERDMMARIGFLASDALRGRDTPSLGLDAAAAYIVSEFRRMGLEPAGEVGFYQYYPFPLVAAAEEGIRLEVHAPGVGELVRGRDYAVSAGVPDEGQGGLVFVGAGAAPEAYARTRGHIALVALPGIFTEREWRLARTQARRRAQEAGAIAVAFAMDPRMGAAEVARLEQMLARPFRALGGLATIPLFYLGHDAAAGLFAAADMDAEAAWRRAVAGPIEPVSLGGVHVVFRSPHRVLEAAVAPNVAAVLRGSDPALRNSYVVFSAHMDHVGVGTPDASGDSIYNGADDNASGTSALMEVAEAFASLSEPPARSIIFLAVSGEEKGLLGSQWYSDHPTVPLESIVANVNIDMIGRNSPDSIVVIGQGYSSLGPLVQRVASARPELGLTVSEDIWPQERFFFRSDHFNFARKEIPALFFFAGVHEDYHRPSDHADKIDAGKATRVARLIFWTAYEMASDPEPPEWTAQGLEEVRALTR